MDSNQNLTQTSEEQEASGQQISKAVIGWGIAAIALSIFMCTSNTSAMVLGASFGGKLLAVIAGSILGLIGALLGDAIRRFSHPDAVFTNGGMFQLIWNKLFWLCGPQLVGLGLGVAIGCALVLR
jgi:uncharacterized membrane protein YvlD (DUF360 family)